MMTDMDVTTDWEGRPGHSCGEHRTVGTRAWCYDDRQWCYPHIPCPGCMTEEDRIREAIDLLKVNGYLVTRRAPAQPPNCTCPEVTGGTRLPDIDCPDHGYAADPARWRS